MNTSARSSIVSFRPEREFFVGVDSDGSVFPTMDLKQKECFVPTIIDHFGLQAIDTYVRETIEFVNLYSKWRGSNRFEALVRVFDMLRHRPEIISTGMEIPTLDKVRGWLASGNPLSNESLDNTVQSGGDPELADLLDWSRKVNEGIAVTAVGLSPFRHCRESIDKVRGRADVAVISATPHEALEREWTEHGMKSFVAVIAGQETGTKTEQLQVMAAGKYAEQHMLMIGDARGDMQAARNVGALFYPIDPGREEESWKQFCDEAADRFFDGAYAGEYECRLIDRFESLLPEVPAWETV